MAVPFKTEVVELLIGSLPFSVEVVVNIDEIFNELASRSSDDPEVKDERIPYWAEIWPSSIRMAEYLVENPHLVKGKKIIELGCGLGLSGIVAGKTGGDVLLTDYQKFALDFAEKNWKRNNKYAAKTRLLDWRFPDISEKFDLIIAADVAYESKMFKPLVNTILKLLSPHGVVLITEPNRKFAKDFITLLKQNHFLVESEMKEIEFKGAIHKVHLHFAQMK